MSSPPTPPPRRSLTRAMLPALAAASLAAAGALAIVTINRSAAPAPTPPQGCVIPAPPGVGGPFALTNGAGETVTEADFSGRPALIYFGFTHCPDVCPISLYLVEQALETLGPAARRLQTALITVDPERDDPAAMQAYAATEGFPAGLVGLTGEPEAVREVLRRYGVTAIKDPLEDGGYNVSHSSFLYILNARGQVAGMVTTIGKTPEEIAACVQQSLGDELADG